MLRFRGYRERRTCPLWNRNLFSDRWRRDFCLEDSQCRTNRHGVSAECWVKPPRKVAFGEPSVGMVLQGIQKLDGEPKEGWPRGGIRTVTMRSVQKLLTPKEVAEGLDVSVDWVHNHAPRKAPRLPVVRRGKLLRLPTLSEDILNAR